MKLQEHIIDHIFEIDDFLDMDMLNAAWTRAKSPYLNKEGEMESMLYSFGLACARKGVEAGFRYGRNPEILIMEVAE